MEGTEEDHGVNFRTLEQVFCMIKEREKLFRYDVSVSVLEVYNEQIRDLLVSDSQPGVAAKRYPEFLVISIHSLLMISTICL
jgi:kinesin family protein C2/C3